MKTQRWQNKRRLNGKWYSDTMHRQGRSYRKSGIIPESDEPGKTRWAMSSTNYTKKAIAEVERQLGTADVSRPESPLKKKHNAIAYHKARESIAAGILRIAKEDSKTNIADILTKLLKGPTLRELSAKCMW